MRQQVIPSKARTIDTIKNRRLKGFNHDKYKSDYLTYLTHADYFRKKYHIKHYSFETLIILYLRHPTLVTISGMYKIQVTTYKAIRDKLLGLIEKGLVNQTGNQYGVSDLFIQELSNIPAV